MKEGDAAKTKLWLHPSYVIEKEKCGKLGIKI
jgi:hypothetical protein